MEKLVFILYCVLSTFTVYQLYLIIYEKIKFNRYRNNLEKEYLNDLKISLAVIRELEMMRDREYEEEFKKAIDNCLTYYKTLSRNYSNALTELQLKKL